MTTADDRSPSSDRILLREADLRTQIVGVLRWLGVPEEDAQVTTDVFLQAELMGEESHGLRLLLHVFGRLQAGGDRAVAEITVVADRGAIAVWDANRSLGQVTAARAMSRAIEKARAHGVGFVAVRNGNSLTSAKYYALMAAALGMIGVVYSNTSRKLMPPPGGRTPVLGNNPVAFAAPAGRAGTFALDMACTQSAMERIVRANELGEPIPLGWALDRDGRDTSNPAKALESLALLPFGGYKAFGLGMVHEILTSVLAGGVVGAGDSTGFQPYDGAMHTSFSLQAIDISAFTPLAQFEERMSLLFQAVKGSAIRSSGDRILIPGERSQGERASRSVHGIPLVADTYERLQTWADRAGVRRVTNT